MPLPHFSLNMCNSSIPKTPLYTSLYEVYFITKDCKKFDCSVFELEISNDKIFCKIYDAANTGMSNFMKLKYVIISIHEKSGLVKRIDMAKIKNIEYKSLYSWSMPNDISTCEVTFNTEDLESIDGDECEDKIDIDSMVKGMIRDEKLGEILK